MLIISAEEKSISEIYGEGNTSPCFLYEIKAELVRAKHGVKSGVLKTWGAPKTWGITWGKNKI